jgi:hypothetical protein
MLPPGTFLDSISFEAVGPRNGEIELEIYSEYYDQGIPTPQNIIFRKRYEKRVNGKERILINTKNTKTLGRFNYLIFRSIDSVMIASDNVEQAPYCSGKRGEEFRTQYIFGENGWQAGLFNFRITVWYSVPMRVENPPLKLFALSEESSRGINIIADDLDKDGDIDLFYGGQFFRAITDGEFIKEELFNNDTLLTFVMHHDLNNQSDLFSIREDSLNNLTLVTFNDVREGAVSVKYKLKGKGTPVSFILESQRFLSIKLIHDGITSEEKIDLGELTSTFHESSSNSAIYPFREGHRFPLGKDPTIIDENVISTIDSFDGFVTGFENGGNKGRFLKPESIGYSTGDLDGDGLVDLVLYSDCPCKSISVFKNSSDGFENVTEEWGLKYINIGPDGIIVDYDKDGDLDIFSSSNRIPVIVENNFNPENNSPNDNRKPDFSRMIANPISGGILKQGPTRFEYDNTSRVLEESLNVDLMSVTVFPNPNDGRFSLSLRLKDDLDNIKGYIYTPNMKKIGRFLNEDLLEGEYGFELNLEDYGAIENGTYFLIFQSGEKNLIINTVVRK